MSKKTRKTSTRKLTVRIALFYVFFMVVNIIFFSIMIFENQTDLMQNSFRYHADSLVKTVQSDLQTIKIQEGQVNIDATGQKLKQILNAYDYRVFFIIDEEANVLFENQNTQESFDTASREAVLKRLDEFKSRDLVFQTPFSTELNEQDFSVDLLMPLDPENTVFLNVVLDMRNMQERLQSLYNQIAIAILWGIIFHVIFGLFVYRVIFKRIFRLKQASQSLAAGDLHARIDWNMKRNDELDELGQSFNSMAETIDQKVTTITTQLDTIEKLNSEIQNELLIGKEVQESLATDLSKFSKFQPELIWKPLREVSGDLCNLYEAKDGSTLILVVDAAGHGVSAALINTLTLVAFEEAIEIHTSPHDILHYMNENLAGRLQSYLYATCILVRIGKNEMQWVGAGHVNCLFYRSIEKRTIELESTGPPLGIIENIEYEQNSMHLQPRDRIMLYTDGVTELENNSGEQFGIERLKLYLKNGSALTTKQLVSKIEEDGMSYSSTVTDDITLLCMEIPF